MTTHDARRAFLGAGMRLLTGASLAGSTIAARFGRPMDLTLTTLDGGTTRVPGSAITALRDTLRGDLLTADTAGYDAAREILERGPRSTAGPHRAVRRRARRRPRHPLRRAP